MAKVAQPRAAGAAQRHRLLIAQLVLAIGCAVGRSQRRLGVAIMKGRVAQLLTEDVLEIVNVGVPSKSDLAVAGGARVSLNCVAMFHM
jgi:hypothetical protein